MSAPQKHRYTKLWVDTIGFVDKGAGKHVPVVIAKRHDAPQEKNNVTVEEALAKVMDPQAKAVLAAALQAQRPQPPAPPAMPPGMPAGMAKIWADAPEDVRKSLRETYEALETEAKKREAAEVAKREAAEKQLAEIVEKQERAEFVEKARGFKHVPGLSTEELGDVLRSVAKGRALPEALAKKFEATLKSVDEVVRKSALFGEIGSLGRGGEDAPLTKLESIAKSLREKDAKLSQAEAFVKACEQNPELYREHREGRRAGA